jgi:hypothetical protein
LHIHDIDRPPNLEMLMPSPGIHNLKMLMPAPGTHGSMVRVCLVCNPVPLGDDHGLKVLALGHLRLDVGDELGKIRHVLRYVSG